MYTGPIIDTHMHFWDLSNAYPWLNSRIRNRAADRQLRSTQAQFPRT